jgi:hypothetical protein
MVRVMLPCQVWNTTKGFVYGRCHVRFWIAGSRKGGPLGHEDAQPAPQHGYSGESRSVKSLEWR